MSSTTTLILAVTAALFVAGGVFMTTPTTVAPSTRLLTESPIKALWTQWKMAQGKSYGTDSEESHRFASFQVNHDRVSASNSNPSNTFELALNQFADLTQAEFKAAYLKTAVSNATKNVVPLAAATSAEVDWTTTGAVTPVKDQAQCGSCWAFSATGAIEGLYFLKNKNQKSFSEQQLMDCSRDFGNMSCNGGLMDGAFEYAAQTGLTEESNYPYLAVDSDCKAVKDGFKIGGHNDVETTNDALKAAIEKQTGSVAIAADSIMMYKGGVYNDWGCGNRLDHGVLAVGYGTDAKLGAFYKVKNSWGASWGEAGFIRFARKDSGEGMCGITNQASYPTL